MPMDFSSSSRSATTALVAMLGAAPRAISSLIRSLKSAHQIFSTPFVTPPNSFFVPLTGG
jgi:hypothetical protein